MLCVLVCLAHVVQAQRPNQVPALRGRVVVSIANDVLLTWDNERFEFVHDHGYRHAKTLLMKDPNRFVRAIQDSLPTRAWHCEVERYLTRGDLSFLLFVQNYPLPSMMSLMHSQMDFAMCKFGGAEWLPFVEHRRSEVVRTLSSYLGRQMKRSP